MKPNKIEQAEREFAKLLVATSQRGFYGEASITLSLQDGHLQHVKIATERVERLEAKSKAT